MCRRDERDVDDDEAHRVRHIVRGQHAVDPLVTRRADRCGAASRCPRPTSTAMTLVAAAAEDVGEAAGRCSRRPGARRPPGRHRRAPAAHAAAADLRMIRRRSSTRASLLTAAPAWNDRPLTATCPARISARARSRDGASPRSTSAMSRRVFFRDTLNQHKGHEVKRCIVSSSA
jgi:hypothetical protein